jgi:hypothetical protein
MSYYPLIDPPLEVLHQAILYGDEIATIVPHDDKQYLHPPLRQADNAGHLPPVEFNLRSEHEPTDLFDSRSQADQESRATLRQDHHYSVANGTKVAEGQPLHLPAPA